LLWDKTDRQEYENTFNCILTQNMDKSEEDTIDKKLDYLTRVMCETAEQIVPKRLIRLDGFNWKKVFWSGLLSNFFIKSSLSVALSFRCCFLRAFFSSFFCQEIGYVRLWVCQPDPTTD
jgi:hypothetical protein